MVRISAERPDQRLLAIAFVAWLGVAVPRAAVTAPIVTPPAEPAAAASSLPESRFALSPADSLARARGSNWGPAPDRVRGPRIAARSPTRPFWETAVMVPYWVGGVPFRALNWGIKKSVVAIQDAGFLDVFAEVERGLPGPFGSYLLPVFGISDARGTEFGLVLHHDHFLGGPHRLRMEASLSTVSARDLHLGTRFQASSRQSIDFGAGDDKDPGAEYFGLGADSRADDRSYYERTVTWIGATTVRQVSHSVRIGVRSVFTMARARTGEHEVDDRERLEEVHAGRLPAGFGAESSGWDIGFWLHHETAPQTGRPAFGGVRDLSMTAFQATDGSGVAYWTYRGDLQQYFRLGHPQRTLAARVFLRKIERRGDVPVPFTRLIANRDPDRLRGFPPDRFLGAGLLGINVDYRWPIFSVSAPDDVGLDAYLFFDTGQAFFDYREVGWRHLRESGGFGLRLIGPRGGFAMRFEVGVSAEDPVFRLDFSQVFQREREGLVGGQVPLAVW